MGANSSVNARTIRAFDYVSWIIMDWDLTHQMNIPRLCEAHRGIRALQSAHISAKLELNGKRNSWETHCCRVGKQVRAKSSDSSLSGACFVATSSPRIEDSVSWQSEANVKFWLAFDNEYLSLDGGSRLATAILLGKCVTAKQSYGSFTRKGNNQ